MIEYLMRNNHSFTCIVKGIYDQFLKIIDITLSHVQNSLTLTLTIITCSKSWENLASFWKWIIHASDTQIHSETSDRLTDGHLVFARLQDPLALDSPTRRPKMKLTRVLTRSG